MADCDNIVYPDEVEEVKNQVIQEEQECEAMELHKLPYFESNVIDCQPSSEDGAKSFSQSTEEEASEENSTWCC